MGFFSLQKDFNKNPETPLKPHSTENKGVILQWAANEWHKQVWASGPVGQRRQMLQCMTKQSKNRQG